MRALSAVLDVPTEILEQEPYEPVAGPSNIEAQSLAAKPMSTPIATPTPTSHKARGKLPSKPWADLPSGLTASEEKADPTLAEAIRESLWASRVRRMELDDDGAVVASPPPTRPSRSPSDTSSASRSPPKLDPIYTEEFSLAPRSVRPITALAKDETTMTLDEIMTTISADDLRKVARARKIPLSMLATRMAVTSALRGIAKKQTVLGFTPLKRQNGQTTLPFTPPRITSEALLVAQLLPYLGDAAI